MRAALVAGLLAAIAAAVPAGAGAAGACTTHVYPGLQPSHLTDLNASPKYNSFPPTSGPHYYLPAKWNIYDFELPQVALVHNLEHGGVVVQYGDKIGKEAVAEIRAWYLRDSNALVVAPLPRLRDKIALTAWNAPRYKQGAKRQDAGRGYLALCTRFDVPAFTAFADRHRYKAGERFPPSLLKRQQT